MESQVLLPPAAVGRGLDLGKEARTPSDQGSPALLSGGRNELVQSTGPVDRTWECGGDGGKHEKSLSANTRGVWEEHSLKEP